MGKEINLLHQARIHNNCPTCYAADGLEFTFKQEVAENPIFIIPNNEIDESLYCHKCENNIYPVDWNEDIDRVHEYQKKLALQNKQSFKLKSLGYFLIIGDVLLLIYLIYYFAN